MIDVVVIYSPVGGGHKAAAIAVAEAARAQGLAVELIDAFDHAPRWAGDAYLAAHLAGQNRAPELYGRMYTSANRKGGILEPLRLEIDQLVFGSLAARVRELDPRLVIATHHLPLVVLGRARREGLLAMPVVGVVTDYTAHACWAEDGVDLWAVACEEARAELAAHGLPIDRIAITGIPVKKAFESVPAPRPSDVLRVLVTSGGFGARPMTRIVESFVDVPDVELTVVCGASEKLRGRIDRVARRVAVPARILGFERDMPARMAEAHVVVGKAGGLTVTETLTAGRPMIVASAVPGNEKVNEARVVRAGAGVAALPEDVGRVVTALRAEHRLGPMGLRARQCVVRGAAGAVLAAAFDRVRPARRAA